MAEWTRDMVEERIVEAADVLERLPAVPSQGYFGTWPEIQRSRKELAEAMPTPRSAAASEHLRDHPDGGDDHLEPLPRAGGGTPDVGARRRAGLEGHLLSLRHQPCDRPPEMGVRAEPDRVAAERTS